MSAFAPKAIAFMALLVLATIVPASAQASPVFLASNQPNGKLIGKNLALSGRESAKNEGTATSPDPSTKQIIKVIVEKGDSLSSIAEKHQTTWVRLYNANDSVADPNIINPGQELRIPSNDEQLADRPLPVAAPAVRYASRPVVSAAPRAAQTTSYPVDQNSAKAFIYSRESGNNPNATNPNGCYGIGQDCNGVVRGTCGADYACQDAYFTNYANARYGGWDGAYAYWQTHGWW